LTQPLDRQSVVVANSTLFWVRTSNGNIFETQGVIHKTLKDESYEKIYYCSYSSVYVHRCG
jgi:hypothetical protein